MFDCKTCGKILSTKRTLNTHVCDGVPNGKICPKCYMTFKNNKNKCNHEKKCYCVRPYMGHYLVFLKDQENTYTNVDITYTNVDSTYANVENTYTNVDITYTNVDNHQKNCTTNFIQMLTSEKKKF
jgi:hypothetical protein